MCVLTTSMSKGITTAKYAHCSRLVLSTVLTWDYLTKHGMPKKQPFYQTSRVILLYCLKKHRNCLFSRRDFTIDSFPDTSFVYSRDLPPGFWRQKDHNIQTLAGGKQIFCFDEVSGRTFENRF